jgi:DNA-binding CsgD family transcriptional regulator
MLSTLVESSIAPSWPLVGREMELEVIAEAMFGGTTGGVVLAGPAGVGRTRLVREVLRRAEAGGWVAQAFTATRALTTVPFGAFARLLAGVDRRTQDRLELFLAVLEALQGAADGRGLVVAVDDAHLLDQAGAALLHQMASTKAAVVLATVRAGESCPEPILSLWKDGPARRLELVPLSLASADDILTAALGGPLDGAALRELWRASRGDLGALHALVETGLEAGALWDAGGIWRWTGPIAGARLLELTAGRFERLQGVERSLLETLALAEPLDLVTLEALAPPDVLEGLEQKEFLEVEREGDGRRHRVRLTNPLVAEALRAAVPHLRARALHRRLGEALESLPRRRRGDLFRLALCHLDAGEAPGADLLLGGGLEAERAARHGAAERLARAALDAGGGLEAGCLLARSLLNQGSIGEAEAILTRLGSLAATPAERARVARDRAAIFVRSVSRALVAPEIVDEQLPVIAGGEEFGPFDAAEAMTALTSGRPEDAMVLVHRLRAWPEVDDVRLLWAAVMASWALALQGRTGEALAGVDRGLELAGTCPDEPPEALLALLAIRSVALRLAGRLVEAERVAEEGYHRALMHENTEARASWSISLGKVAMARGRLSRGIRLFLEAVALARGEGRSGLVAWALGNLATAAAMAGEAGVAEDALSEAVALEHALPGIFGVDLALARAWVAASAGEACRAAVLAVEAARMAESRGQNALAAVAWHDAARLGRPEAAAEPLGRLASRLDGGLVAAFAAHARALAASDAAGLDRAGAAFQSMGADLLAAEATSEAAAAYRESGAASTAGAVAWRASALAASCESGRTPALLRTSADQPLTPREWEVATLAARGLSNREMATRLFVSLRTVENHLHRIFSKLGIASRRELRWLVEPRAAAR